MVLGSSKAPGPLPLPAWEKVQDLVALDKLQFHQVHRKLYAHRQRVEEVRANYNAEENERQSDAMRARAESMRQNRKKHQEEAHMDVKRENQRLVERLCLVMRESEQRQRQMMLPKPPSSAPAAAGTLNLHVRRKAAQKIDKDNKALLDRIIRAGPHIITRDELKARYQEHHKHVKRRTRIKRSWSKTDILTTPPPRSLQPSGNRAQRSGKEAARARGLAPLPKANSAPSSVASMRSEESSVGAPTPPQQPPKRPSRPSNRPGAGRRPTPETQTGKDRPPEEVQLAQQVARDEVHKISQSVVERLSSDSSLAFPSVTELAPASDEPSRQFPAVEASESEEEEDEYDDDYEAEEDAYGDEDFEEDEDVASPTSKTAPEEDEEEDEESPQPSDRSQRDEGEYTNDFELSEQRTGRLPQEDSYDGLEEDREDDDMLDLSRPEAAPGQDYPKVGLGRTTSDVSEDYESFERDESSFERSATGASQRIPAGLRSTSDLGEGDLGRSEGLRRSPGTYTAEDNWFEDDESGSDSEKRG